MHAEIARREERMRMIEGFIGLIVVPPLLVLTYWWLHPCPPHAQAYNNILSEFSRWLSEPIENPRVGERDTASLPYCRIAATLGWRS